ncbi:hypothetical protein [Streptomyces vinaceus]|uniref:hypothetical protein n=1 Tax=Streptomyces vinaceus TaxID=1960 RepID=UPI00369ADB78
MENLFCRYGPEVWGFFADLPDPDEASVEDLVTAVFLSIDGSQGFYLTDMSEAGSAEEFLAAGPVTDFGGDPRTLSEAYALLVGEFGLTVQILQKPVLFPPGSDYLAGVAPNVSNGWILYEDYQWINDPLLGERHLAINYDFCEKYEMVEAKDEEGNDCLMSDGLDWNLYRASADSRYQWIVKPFPFEV